MTRKQRIQKRNQQVREFFCALETKNPQWKLSALLQTTAEAFPPLSAATVSAILKRSGNYAD